MTGTVLCFTHNNFLYLRGRVAKFIQKVHLLKVQVNELSMTGTVLCCTHNFLYLRGRIAKFIQEVYPLKVQVKFECELNLIKVKSQ